MSLIYCKLFRMQIHLSSSSASHGSICRMPLLFLMNIFTNTASFSIPRIAMTASSLFSNLGHMVALLLCGKNNLMLMPLFSNPHPVVSLLFPSKSLAFQTSIHITIYLTTSGRDAEFMEDLAILQNTIDIVNERYPDAVVSLLMKASSLLF